MDAQTSVALERKLDTMMRLTRVDRATQGFNAKTKSKTESTNGEGWCGGGFCRDEGEEEGEEAGRTELEQRETQDEDNTEHNGDEWAMY